MILKENRMEKITDPAYFLPWIHALQGFRVFTSGATKPQAIRGVCSTTGNKEDYIVKYIGAQRMSPESSCRELLASFIGAQLDLYVPDPAIIIVTQKFVDTLRGNDGFRNAQNSIGNNFGCKLINDLQPLIKGLKFTDHQCKEAEKIFAFDAFISNPDRNNEKHNMLTDGEKILIFDHELAFAFVFDIISNPTPWILADSDKTWLKQHYFYPVLKNNEPNLEEFVERFVRLDSEFWKKALTLIPQAWITPQTFKIRTTLEALIVHKTIFLDNLKKLVS